MPTTRPPAAAITQEATVCRADTPADDPVVNSMVRSPSAHQASYHVVYTALRRVLREGMQAGPGAEEGIDALQCRVSGALYALLMAHPIDRHGRCRCCRRPGSVIGRRRQSCAVYVEVSHWLHQPEEPLRAWIAHQWGLTRSAPGLATTPQAGQRLP